MLLTLHANSLRPLLVPRDGSSEPDLALLDLPVKTFEEFGLRGLNLPTWLLAGVSRELIAKLRDRADKVGCACLLLSELTPHDFGSLDSSVTDASVQRSIKIVEAASLLGCNSAAIQVKDKPGDAVAVDRIAANIRRVVDYAERFEVNLLISPHAGFTSEAKQLTELIKKVGGFRIGTLPDFQSASRDAEPEVYIKRLAPYASVVLASTVEFADIPEPEQPEAFDPDEEIDLDAPFLDALLGDAPPHLTYPLEPLVSSLVAVGFDQTLAIDYRGEGDCEMGVLRSRAAIEAAVESVQAEG